MIRKFKLNLFIIILIVTLILLVINNIRYKYVIIKYDKIIKNNHNNQIKKENNLLNQYTIEQKINFQQLTDILLIDEKSKKNITLSYLIKTKDIKVLIIFDQYKCGNCFNILLREVGDLPNSVIIHAPKSNIKRIDNLRIIRSLTKLDVYCDLNQNLMKQIGYNLMHTPLIALINPINNKVICTYIFDIDYKTDYKTYVRRLKEYLQKISE